MRGWSVAESMRMFEGFDIAVEDALGVGVMDGFGDGFDVLSGAPGREGLRADKLGEVLALDVIHGEVGLAFEQADFVDGDDVRVLEKTGGGGFGAEALGGLFSGELLNHFDGDDAAEGPLA